MQERTGERDTEESARKRREETTDGEQDSEKLRNHDPTNPKTDFLYIPNCLVVVTSSRRKRTCMLKEKE